jgi:nitrate/nitrite-specific signal transduction histidine kinase
MIETPLRDLNDQLTAAFWRITLSALATLGLLIGLMILALRKFVFQPVSALTNGMTAIQRGNLDDALAVPSRDELGELAETFNAMRQQLKTSRVKNDLLLAETRRREQETNALHQLLLKISSSLETPQVLDEIAQGARQILGTDIGIVALTDETQAEIQAKACSGARTDILKRIALPVREWFAGAVPTEPICIEAWRTDLPIPHIAELIAEEGIVSSLAAPMGHGGRLYGYVATMTRQPRHFTKQDTLLLTQLALQVVAAIENAELYRRARYVSTLEERDRLAREMHDNLAQVLGYMNIKTAIVDDLLAKDQVEPARASLLELKQITKEAYTDVREAIFNLRRTWSAGSGLIPQLKDYLSEYQTHYGIDTQLIVEDTRLGEFPEEVKVQVNRIIQEALTNVRKHSGATKAWVRFQQTDHHVTIRIEDNGRGFDLAPHGQNGSEHFGLQIMRERAASVGGEFQVDSQPGLGTRIKLELAIFPQFEDPHENTRCLAGR